MNNIICALDVSKGYADVILTAPDTSILATRRLDDLPDGHVALGRLLMDAQERYPDTPVRCGVETTGGLERNWLRTLRVLARKWKDCGRPAFESFALNPLAVTSMLRHDLHRAVTDAHSARGIAEYLRLIAAPAASTTPWQSQGVRLFLNLITSKCEQGRQLRNELQSCLPYAFPELVPYCRSGIPRYVLRILERYPGPRKLARAHVETLTRIPHVDRTRAEALRLAARQSVTAIDPSAEARLVAEETAAVVREYAVQILETEDCLLRLEKQLIARMRAHPAFASLVSIPGIGELSAAKIITLIGDVARFPNASALVAFAGLDPRVRQSGDMRAPRRISKRGNPLLRATLYLNASVAVRYPGPLSNFYHRLREAGKVHRVAIVACMNKLLRIIYACWLKQEMFDPYRLTHVSKAGSENRYGTITVRHKPEEILAPISRREAIRRYQQKERKEVSLPKRE